MARRLRSSATATSISTEAGTGPLVGDSSPIEARIILTRDAFHAMTTDRPYRKRLSTREAIRRLKENSGTQFDPSAVAACVNIDRKDLVA